MKRPDRLYFRKLPDDLPKATLKFTLEAYEKVNDDDEEYIRMDLVEGVE